MRHSTKVEHTVVFTEDEAKQLRNALSSVFGLLANAGDKPSIWDQNGLLLQLRVQLGGPEGYER